MKAKKFDLSEVESNTYIINLFDSMKSFIDNQNISENQKLYFGQVIFYNVFYTLKKCFPKNLIDAENYSIKLHMTVRNSIPIKMLEQHLKLTLNDILYNCSSKIQIKFEPLYNKKNKQAAS